MAVLTVESPGDEIAVVLVDTQKLKANSVAQDLIELEITEGGIVVAAVYWVDVIKGQYDLKAGVRATSPGNLDLLVTGPAGIEAHEDVINAEIVYQIFRIIDGARDGGP